MYAKCATSCLCICVSLLVFICYTSFISCRILRRTFCSIIFIAIVNVCSSKETGKIFTLVRNENVNVFVVSICAEKNIRGMFKQRSIKSHIQNCRNVSTTAVATQFVSMLLHPSIQPTNWMKWTHYSTCRCCRCYFHWFFFSILFIHHQNWRIYIRMKYLALVSVVLQPLFVIHV